MVDNMIPATDGGKIVKMEVDFSSTCDEQIPICRSLAEAGRLHDALDKLLSLEKQTRTVADMASTARILVTVVQLCAEAGNWALLNEHVTLLAKRRSQLKQAVGKMVKECCELVDKTPDKETKLKLIETLRSVTEGKIYVEVERARLTHILAKIKEADGEITEAANIIEELQVETYGSMDKAEKVELILEQMRFCLAKKDYIRTQIIAKKINTRFFEDEKAHPEKLKYYKLMIEMDEHSGAYLSICKHYRAILATPSVDKENARMVLQNVVLYLVLSPYDNEQADLAHRIKEDVQLEEIAPYKDLLEMFMNPEIIQWAFVVKMYRDVLINGADGLRPTSVFALDNEDGVKRWKDLQNRVVEHNIRIIAKYYTRITMKRMSEHLDLSLEETEEFLSKLVVKKQVDARTDRPAGIVCFAHNKQPDAILNEWSSNLNALMDLLNKTTHLINREECVHNHLFAQMNPAITFCHSAGSQIDGCCWCLPFILLVAMDTKLRVLATSRFISFSPEQVDRFLRLRTFVFHLITFLWHAFLNYHTTNVVFYIFETRMDLVRQTYGLGAQYITLWNQVIQQSYFNACLLQDILEFTPPDKYLKTKIFLKEKLPYVFSSVVMPLSFMVSINFWPMYSLNRPIIDEFDVTASYFPYWVNHGLHTIILLLVIVEKLVVYRSYPTMLYGFAGLCCVIWAYVFTCAFFYFVSGFWPYPLFGVMSNLQRLSYITFNCLLGLFIFVIGQKINRKIWGAKGELVKKIS